MLEIFYCEYVPIHFSIIDIQPVKHDIEHLSTYACCISMIKYTIYHRDICNKLCKLHTENSTNYTSRIVVLISNIIA